MILNNQRQIEEDSFGDFGKEMEASIDTSQIVKLYHMLTEGLYSNPEGSIVREITSNCFDAHMEAYKAGDLEALDRPARVKIGYIEGEYYISFIDRGLGMSPEKMESIYMKLLSSTKEDSNDFFGAFGLGSKTPLSYADNYEINTVYNGIEYNYVYSKGIPLPKLSLIGEKATGKPSGTEIKIWIYNYTDKRKFESEIARQLMYFDNVFVESMFGDTFDNNYSILEADTFKVRIPSEGSGWQNPYKEMHIILGKVVYPIDWNKLQIPSISIPIGLKFEIGELQVPMNRESIIYDDETVKFIKSRIESCKEEIKRRYLAQNKEGVSLREFFKRSENSNTKILRLGDYEIPIVKREEWNSKTYTYDKVDVIPDLPLPKIKGLEDIEVVIHKNILDIFFNIKEVIDGTKKRDKASVNFYDNLIKEEKVRNKTVKFYRLKGTRNKDTDKYLNWLASNENCLIAIVERKKVNLNNFLYYIEPNYKDLRAIKKAKEKEIGIPFINDKLNKSKVYKILKKVITEQLVEITESYDKTLPTLEFRLWERERRENNRRIRSKIEGHINIHRIDIGISTVLNLEELANNTGVVIYAENNNRTRLRVIYNMISGNIGGSINPKALLPITTAKSNFKYFTNYEYQMHVEDFINNGNKIFRDRITAYLVYKRLQEIERDFGGFIRYLELYSEKEQERRNNLSSYINKKGRHFWYRTDDEFLKECIEVAKTNNWIDKYWIDEVEKFADFFKGLKLLSLINTSNENYGLFKSESVIPDVVEFLKLKKKRLNFKHYQIQPIKVPFSLPKGIMRTKKLILDEITEHHKSLILASNNLEEVPEQLNPTNHD